MREIVTAVDLDDHCIVVDAPAGLFSEDDMIVVDGDDLAGALSAAGDALSAAEESMTEENSAEEVK